MDEPAQTQSARNAPTVLDCRYEIISQLGQGSVGVVYRVRDLKVRNQICALKLLYPHLISEPAALLRFQREVLLSRALPHPCIAQVYEFQHRSNELCYYTMEYVAGVSLAELLASSPNNSLSIELTAYLAWQITSALAVAHGKGIVHRDVKPQNIMVAADNCVKITDFGLACLVEDDSGATRSGASLGTPYYMSPEQFRGEKVDTRSDLYSFGIVLFEMLCGVRPFRSEVFYRLAIEHLTNPLPEAKSFRPDLPPWLTTILSLCTEKAAAKRALSAEQLAENFSAHLADEFQAGFQQLRCKSRAQARKSKVLEFSKIGLLLTLLLGLLAVIIGSWSRYDSACYKAIGVKLLQAELLVGHDLWPLRSVAGIRVSARDALKIREMMLYSAGDNKEVRNDMHVLTHSGSIWKYSGENSPALFLYACKYASSYQIESLLEYPEEARLSALDDEGFGCVHYAAQRRLYQVMEKLGLAGARGDLRDLSGETPYHAAARIGDVSVLVPALKFLSHDGPENPLSIRNKFGETALHVALLRGAPANFIKQMLEGGADPKQDFPNGESTLAYADRTGKTEIAKLISSDRN